MTSLPKIQIIDYLQADADYFPQALIQFIQDDIASFGFHVLDECFHTPFQLLYFFHQQTGINYRDPNAASLFRLQKADSKIRYYKFAILLTAIQKASLVVVSQRKNKIGGK